MNASIQHEFLIIYEHFSLKPARFLMCKKLSSNYCRLTFVSNLLCTLNNKQ